MQDFIPPVALSEFSYDLPEDRIALFPVHPRHNSRLLVRDQSTNSHHLFRELPELLSSDTFLVFNNTKVIPARLLFETAGGQPVEIFLLNPLNPDWTEWECQIGNRRRFKDNVKLTAQKKHKGTTLVLEAEWIAREENKVRLSCNSGLGFHELVEMFGKVPLPPYIKRSPVDDDTKDYQTVFASEEGAVAAPTASLHFTTMVLDDLRSRQIQFDYLTLHVGLGTFKPVTAATAQEHDMHQESFAVSAAFLENLIQNLHKTITPSGTTAMRVLESLYYVGASVLCNKPEPHVIPSDAGFNPEFQGFDTRTALEAALMLAQQNGGVIAGKTSIFILPGFVFRFSKALITNFHQPGSTLLLLVAAFVGPGWRSIYAEALAAGYRFLSYGDAMLLRPGAVVKGQ